MDLFMIGIIAGLLVVPVIVMIPVFKILAPIYAYSYPNARLRAMRARLLDDQQLLALTNKKYTDILYTLEQGEFSELKAVIGPDTSFSTIEKALRAHMIKTLGKIKSMSPAQSQKFVSAYLARYDVSVIKSIVRLQKISGSLDHDLLNVTTLFSNEFITRDNISVTDLENELKGTAYGSLLSEYKDQIAQGKYLEFEKRLDQLFFSRLLHSATSIETRRFVKRQIDLRNISLALKGVMPHISNGRIPLERFEGTLDLAKVTAILKQYGYETQATTPEGIERDLQLSFKKLGEDYLTRNPLSENSIIGFIITKNVNIRNILTILKLRYHDVDEAKIKEVLAI